MKRLITTVAAVALAASTLQTYAAGDVAAGKEKSGVCAACHGADGNSTNPQWPKLAGQHAGYVAKQLADYKAGAQRRNEVMAPMAAGLSDQDMLDLAAFYSIQASTGGFAAEAQAELGERIYRGGNPETGVAACTACHGPRGTGDPRGGFPMLAGQHAEYTAGQLRAFRTMERANDVNRMMREVARWMSDEEIEAVSHYIAGLH